MKKILIWLSLVILSSCNQNRSPASILSDPDWESPGTYSLQLLVNNHQRTAMIHIPECVGSDPLAVVFMFHGGGGTAAAAIEETGWIKQAEESCFFAVFPEGLPPDPSKKASFLTNPQRWNDGSGRFNQGVDEVEFISQLLGELEKNLAIDPQMIFATGFSNGASMAFQVGEEMGDQFSAIAPVAGALWNQNVQLEQPVSLLYITGMDDPLNPLEGGVPRFIFQNKPRRFEKEKPPVSGHLQYWAESLACNPIPSKTEPSNDVYKISYRSCSNNATLEAYLIAGLGHAWPGGDSILPALLVGKTSNSLEATPVIWDFFQANSRR